MCGIAAECRSSAWLVSLAREGRAEMPFWWWSDEARRVILHAVCYSQFIRTGLVRAGGDCDIASRAEQGFQAQLECNASKTKAPAGLADDGVG